MTHLAARLKDFTVDFKNNEKEHYVKLKEFHGDENVDQKNMDDKYF